MPANPFRAKIRMALDNTDLQSALDANAERRLEARTTAFASLPEDLQTLRQRAHLVRAETIDNHDRYLSQFIDNATANGLTVHRAADASQAVQIALSIAQNNNATLVAKSKTMVSEEIELNNALIDAGITPVETDLGEYIIQLRGEPPSHIITPAVHLNRADVGKTFHEKLGIPLTDDISELTNAARLTLRQTFLKADVGISGVNFGVAENGSLCLVTNEGNGRMVTTLPPVHIALMGIERLVPTLDDLALMLTLLPRSATGQKLSVYTQLIQTARRVGESDGPHERHLILVDNGRLRLRNSPLVESLYCIRCGACLNACPVFREISGHAYVGDRGETTPYPGPIGSVISPGLFGQANFGHLAQASTLCGACKEACPIDIDLPTLLLRVRAGGIQLKETTGQQRKPEGIPLSINLALRIFSWFAEKGPRFGFALKIAGWFSQFLAPRSGWLYLPPFTGWGFSRDLPKPARVPFRERWSKGLHADHAATHTDVSLFNNEESTLSPDHSSGTPQPAVIHAMVERFESELIALGGTFTECPASQLVNQILSLLRERDQTEIAAWDADQLPPGTLESIKKKGIQIAHSPDPNLLVGLTGAVAGIADTGTLVIPSGMGKHQWVSLLPQIHVAILQKETIYQNLAEVLNLSEVRDASSVALISGPSRTADIEMTLTIGVHGPGEVHVFCIS